VKTALAAAGALLATLVLLELGVAGMVRAGWLDLPAPRHGPDLLWDGEDPRFGVWHHPNAQAMLASDCFQVGYRTNSVGARDVERSLEAEAPRIVVLGDSFAEGWGVRPRERFSNRLEQSTGLEHLNFGMAHFGPYQAALAYRELASRYAHTGVILALVPVNDFVDLDFESAKGATAYEHRYRPYLVRDGAGFRRYDHREPALARWLRRHTWLHAAADRALVLWRRRLFGASAYGAYDAPPGFSWFYDFSKAQIALLEASLEQIAQAAGERRLAIVLIPSRSDLERYERDGPDPLSARLAEFASRRGARIVNLLPPLHAAARGTLERFKRYELPCDYHWNADAHALAARLIERELAGYLYPLASGSGADEARSAESARARERVSR
jgi:hypothetical protein